MLKQCNKSFTLNDDMPTFLVGLGKPFDTVGPLVMSKCGYSKESNDHLPFALIGYITIL